MCSDCWQRPMLSRPRVISFLPSRYFFGVLVNRGEHNPPRAFMMRAGTGPQAARDSGPTEPHEQRARLEALFGGRSNGGAAPRHATASRASSGARRPMGRTPSEYRMRFERLRLAREPSDICEAADLFLRHHQVPDDVDILVKLLHHPGEKVLREAMGQLSSLIFQGRLHSTLLLRERLDAIEARPGLEASTISLLQGLRGQLDHMAGPAAAAAEDLAATSAEGAEPAAAEPAILASAGATGAASADAAAVAARQTAAAAASPGEAEMPAASPAELPPAAAEDIS